MERVIFRRLTPIEEVLSKLEQHFKIEPLGVEVISLDKACGRVLAENIEAEIDVPPFDRAAMDGYAVRAEDTFGADEVKPVKLKIVGEITAGSKPTVEVRRGEAIEIATGAPIPKGANAVVMVEYTERKNSELYVYKSCVPGENIMAAGSDIMAGELILRRNTLLTPRETGVLAALGRTKIAVYRKPKVAIISTGDEIVQPGSKLDYGKIYDVNARTIADSVIECGGEPIFMGIVPDAERELRQRLLAALESCDLVLTSGGTSAGVGDLLYRVVDSLGKPGVIVHGIAVKPGKPTFIAVVKNKLVIGLPGYPTSCLTIFDIIVRPVLRRLAGLSPSVERKAINAKTATKIFLSGGRREYVAVNITVSEKGEYFAYPLPTGSGAITTLAKADGFIEVPEDRNFLEANEPVKVKLFSEEIRPVDLMIIGSHCVGIDLLLEHMRKRGYSFTQKVIHVGSSGGLMAIRRGEADIAGSHLLDESTGEYNVPYLERYGLADKAVLVRGYVRRQGLIVRKGNPKNIRSFEDFLREDVTIINRNPGSGTRILLDKYLREIAEKTGENFDKLTSKIKGYHVEAKTHTSVAVAVLHGKADVGLGIETVARRYGLDFIPIQDEQYDFVVRRERLSKSVVSAFIETLSSTEFHRAITEKLPGLVPTKDSGKIIWP